MLDHKQRRLINSWIALAEQPGTDEYNRFMALWIAFNAYCYAHYAAHAQRERADVGRSRGLHALPDDQQQIEGTIKRTNNKVTIDLQNPTTLRIVIAEKYTEDHIFQAFARDNQAHYEQLLDNEDFSAAVKQLQEALTKPTGKHYVVNMAKARQHDPHGNLEAQASKNIIIPFNDTTSLRQLKDTLYQIRCNIFHGEKNPGEPNDDHIVRTATPVLKAILELALATED